MKSLKLSTILLLTLASTAPYTHAQLVGGHSYMKGNYVELSIDGNGAFEGAPFNPWAPPLPGYHHRSGNNVLGFVANPQMDGWGNFDGDFFTPGTQENGWGFTLIDGATNISKGNNCNFLNEIPCSVQSYHHDPVTGCIETQTTGNWTGGAGYSIGFDIDYLLKENDLYYTTTVTMTNNSTQAIDNFYYYRSFDPDNNQPISFDFSTTNTVVAQPTPTCARAHVSAVSNTPWTSYVGLAGIGQNFRVSQGGFSNRNGSDIWNALPGLFPSFTTITSDGSWGGDNAISLAYRVQNWMPGQTVTFKFVVILDDAAATNAINNLFYFDYEGSLGGPPPECTIYMDSVKSCTGNPVQLSVQGPVVGDFTWTWTPTTGLTPSTGPVVTANPPTPTVYTVTGTPLTSCYTSTITQSVFVDIVEGPDISYTDPGPQCNSFDLTTLVHVDSNEIDDPGIGFYTVVPETLEDTTDFVYPGTIITPTSPAVYLVYWDRVAGCIDFEEVTITWGSLGANMAVQNPDCGFDNGQIIITVTSSTPTASYTYSLNGAPAVTSGTFTDLPIGAYTIHIEDGLGCELNLDTTLIEVNAPSISSVVPALTSCTYTCDGSLTVTGTGGTTPYTYMVGSGTPQTSNVLGSLCPGVYTVTLIDSVGCSASVSASVGIPAPFTITPSNGQTICIGQTATMSASTSGGATPITIVWNSGEFPNGPSLTVDPAGTTTYNVHAEDANGCISNTGNITIVENPPLSVVANNTISICPGDSAQISVASATGGNGGPYSFAWSNDQTPGVLLGATQTVHPTVTTTYTVTITDGCTSDPNTSTTQVIVHPLPAISFTADRLEGCSPVVVTFTNTTPALSSGACSWEFSDGGTGMGCVTTHSFEKADCFDVTLRDITVNGCSIDTTITDLICVHAIPQPEFTWNPHAPNVFDPIVYFENLTIGGSTYEWTIAGMDTTNEINPSHIFPEDSSGLYQVCLTATSDYGCIDSICHDVLIQGELILYAPNAFTPDGNGLNDVFIPIIQDEAPETYEFTVFNRWGQIVFKTTNTLSGWDGTFNGIKAKEDVYVWKVTVKEKVNSEKHEFKGYVTLLR